MKEHLKVFIVSLIFSLSCTSQRGVPNYKVTPNGHVIWRYTKPGGLKKDILSTGDTLASTGDSIYVIKKRFL